MGHCSRSICAAFAQHSRSIMGFTLVHVLVHAVISAVPTEAGTKADAVIKQLRRDFSPAEVLAAIEYLSKGGWIYSTISDDIFLPMDQYPRSTRRRRVKCPVA